MNEPIKATTAERIAKFCERICKAASERKIGLYMGKTPTGWEWEWQGHGMGSTTAHTQPVALFHACRDMDMVTEHELEVTK
jgi:hypothetical protein